MSLENHIMMKDPDRSFLIHHETQSFSSWHYHPEFEIVLILKGKGRRLVGDNVDHFRKYDLILVGPNLPHAWICDKEFNDHPEGFQGEAIVIQFDYDFLGTEFFEVPENRNLKYMLEESSRGIMFSGKTRDKLISLMKNCYNLPGQDQLHLLLTIFKYMSASKEYHLLSSTGFMEPYHLKGNEPIQKVLDYILHNFNRIITVKEMLDIANMSNTTFCIAFKRITRMTFKEYLLQTRIGYACKLLTSSSMTISQIALHCGFDNLSNFNHKFKKLKSATPSEFRKLADSLKTYP